MSLGDDDRDDDGRDGEEGVDAPAPDEDDPDASTLVRGTDVHVQSAAAAFRGFVRNFVSVEDSERAVRTAEHRGAAGGEDT